MARTISVAPQDPSDPFTTADLDGTVVDGAEALRQRIQEAIEFRFGTWFLRRLDGLDYDLIIGHRIAPGQAAGVLSATIREEAGDELVALRNVRYELDPGREFRYSVIVEHVHGEAFSFAVTLP